MLVLVPVHIHIHVHVHVHINIYVHFRFWEAAGSTSCGVLHTRRGPEGFEEIGCREGKQRKKMVGKEKREVKLHVFA